jgi:outer membrane protein TolC
MKVTVMFLLLVLNQQGLAQVPQAQKEPQALDFETLTLDQATSFALTHAPAMQEAQLTVALAELDLKQTSFWNQLVPDLTLHQGYNPVIGESRVGFGLSLDLNKILSQRHNSKQAKLQYFNAEIYLTTVQNKVVLSVTKSYYDFIAAKAQVEILEDQLQTQLKLQEIQKIQFESGQAPLNQVLNALHTIATTKLALLKAQAEVKLQELQLKQTIGFDNTKKNSPPSEGLPAGAPAQAGGD